MPWLTKLSSKRSFRTPWGHLTGSTKLFGSIPSCSAAECSVPAGRAVPVQHVHSPERCKQPCAEQTHPACGGAALLPWELLAPEILDTKTKCTVSRALTGSCVLPFSELYIRQTHSTICNYSRSDPNLILNLILNVTCWFLITHFSRWNRMNPARRTVNVAADT